MSPAAGARRRGTDGGAKGPGAGFLPQELCDPGGAEPSPLGARRRRSWRQLAALAGNQPAAASSPVIGFCAISRPVGGGTCIFRSEGPAKLLISLMARTVLAYFEVQSARLFDAPLTLC
jgi:hypothetical protein